MEEAKSVGRSEREPRWVPSVGPLSGNGRLFDGLEGDQVVMLTPLVLVHDAQHLALFGFGFGGNSFEHLFVGKLLVVLHKLVRLFELALVELCLLVVEVLQHVSLVVDQLLKPAKKGCTYCSF